MFGVAARHDPKGPAAPESDFRAGLFRAPIQGAGVAAGLFAAEVFAGPDDESVVFLVELDVLG